MIKEITDNELLELIKENDEDALKTLIESYTPIINNIISKYKVKAFQLGFDISDLYQESLIGLIKAIKNYDEYKEASFKTYANIIINRHLIDLIKANTRSKHKTLNEALSLDSYEEQTNYLHNLLEVDNYTPEIKLIDLEEQEELQKILTDFELKVYELKIDGKSVEEISNILNKDSKSISNTIQRIKTKIKQKI